MPSCSVLQTMLIISTFYHLMETCENYYQFCEHIVDHCMRYTMCERSYKSTSEMLPVIDWCNFVSWPGFGTAAMLWGLLFLPCDFASCAGFLAWVIPSLLFHFNLEPCAAVLK